MTNAGKIAALDGGPALAAAAAAASARGRERQLQWELTRHAVAEWKLPMTAVSTSNPPLSVLGSGIAQPCG